MRPRPPYTPSDTRHEATQPTAGALLDEVEPLIDAIPLYGPPIVFFAGPWILVALLLCGPFALLMTVVIALLAAGLAIVAIAAVAASPYLLVRHLRSAWAHRSASGALVPPLPANPPARTELALLSRTTT
jgi:hypothetical protein